jgi:hypothetical protein
MAVFQSFLKALADKKYFLLAKCFTGRSDGDDSGELMQGSMVSSAPWLIQRLFAVTSGADQAGSDQAREWLQ